MPTHRAYFDGCPTSHALDLIGDRWVLLIVRELLLGGKRFTDLLRGLPRISRNVLSVRLDDLEAAGVLQRRTMPPPSAAAVYELTERGLELETVLQAIGRWGVNSPFLPLSDSLGVDTFVLGLRGTFDRTVAGDTNSRYELRVGADSFDIHIAHGTISIRRGAADGPAVALNVDVSAMASVARGDSPLATALSPVEGSAAEKVAEFAALFQPAAARPERCISNI
jgi:DNA-binding HxlR family transcriptional regulator